MAANPKIVVRFDFPYDPVMEARFAREADIELVTCARAAAEAETRTALAEALVYIISSAKDELPRAIKRLDFSSKPRPRIPPAAPRRGP